MTQDVDVRWVAGFWHRIGAFIIDSLILSVFGFLIGLLFEDAFVALGNWGFLIGLTIALGYFGISNSAVTNGQTFGKKLLKIRVVDSTNATISMGKSLLRYSVLGLPMYLNGTTLPDGFTASWLIYPLSLIVFGGFSQ